jgi:hypothetical protein
MADPARRVISHVDPMFTLAVVPTGILANPRCISDPEQLAKHICNAAAPVDRRLRIAGEKIKHVVVAGPACIATAIDDITPTYVEVSYNHVSFRRHLDDAGESGDGFHIPSVVGDDPVVGEYLAGLNKLSRESIDDLDLSDYEDRARITSDVVRHLEADRFCRANQKAESKRFEQITNDWFDVPTAKHALILGDGVNPHEHIVDHANGSNEWIKYPTGCDGMIIDETIDGSGNDGLSWVQAAVFDPRFQKQVVYSRLSDRQKREIYQWLTEAGRQYLSFPQSTSKPTHASATDGTASPTAETA